MANWKYGISFAESSPLSAPLPLAGDLYENMEKAARLGYQAVEFHTREQFTFDYARICQMRERGFDGVCMLVTGRLYTQGGYSLLDEDPECAEACLAGMRQYIDKAAPLGAGVVLGWAKGSVKQGEDYASAMDRLASRLRLLNDYSAEKKVPLVLEVINHYETNIFNTAEETVRYLEAYELENCFVHLDTYHMNIEERDPYQAIRRCGKRLGYVHVADNSRRYPGSGQLDFGRLLRALREIDYQGWVTVECIPEPDRDTAAKKAIAYLKNCSIGL